MRHLFIFLLLTLTACGFHLRGSVEIPPYLKTLQLQDASPATRIAPALERALRDEGVTITDDAAQVNAVLRLHSESFSRRVQAVDASGKAQEYGLRYAVVFSVLGPDGTAWLSNATVSSARDLRFDEGAVLGAGGEQAQLQAEMRAEVLRSILRQLARVTPVAAEAERVPAAGSRP